MSESVKWIQYKGKDILYCDFSNLGEEYLLKAINDQKTEEVNCGKSKILVLHKAPNIKITQKVKKESDELANKLESNGIKNIGAIFGITGLQRIIASVIKKDMYFAKSEEDAKEWLVKQE